MNDLSDKEKLVIELLKQSDKSFTELQESSGNALKSDATLTRVLKKLKRRKLIEKYEADIPDSRIKSRNRLTEDYYKQTKISDKNIFSDLIHSQFNWQSNFNQIKDHLELEYPIFFQRTESSRFKELYSDVFSYLVFFGVESEIYKEKPKRFYNFILFLILNHPDQKYAEYRQFINLDSLKFQDLIEKYTNKRKIIEFKLYDSNLNFQQKLYLIEDDPLLYRIRQQIEITYLKFLLCWQFSKIQLEDHFELLFNFSHYILQDLLDLYKGKNDNNTLEFLNKYRICILVYIRENIMDYLQNIDLKKNAKQNFLQFPLQLLPVDQKEEYRRELILSPIAFPSNESNEIENYFTKHVDKNKTNIITKLKEIIKNLIEKIQDVEIIPYHQEDVLYLMSHLLLLLRIYHHTDKKSLKEFKQKKRETKKTDYLSYRLLSTKTFKKIISLPRELRKEKLIQKFMIRTFLERIDHLLYRLKNQKEPKENYIEDIREVFNHASELIEEKYHYFFLKKKAKIYFLGHNLFTESEVFEILRFLIINYPDNSELGHYIIKFACMSKNAKNVNDLLKNCRWKLSEKIHLLEGYILEIPSEINLEAFLNIDIKSLNEICNLELEFGRVRLIMLIKILGRFSLRKNEILTAILYFYLATELDQDGLNPNLRNQGYYMYYYPYLEFISLNKQYFNNINQNDFKISYNLNLIYKFLFKKELKYHIKDILKNLPQLVRALEYIKQFFLITPNIENLLYTIDSKRYSGEIFKKYRYIFSRLEERREIIKKLEDQGLNESLNNNDKDLLSKAEELIENYLDIFNDSFFKGTLINISIITGKLLKILTDNIDKKETKSKQENVKIKPGSSYFFQKDFYKLFTFKSEENSLNYYIMSRLEDLIHPDEKIQDIDKLDLSYVENKFPIDREKSSSYALNLAFPEKYSEIFEIQYDWENIFENHKENKIILFEFSDIFFHSNPTFLRFKNFEKFSKEMMDCHGIEWSIRYIDIFISYIFWFYGRSDVHRFIFFKDISTYNFLVDFCISCIKAQLYWNYHDRNMVKNHINKANELLISFKDIDNFPELKRFIDDFKIQLESLQNKIF